jgi:hypothetical protein
MAGRGIIVVTRKEYREAEGRLRESIRLRGFGLPHTYPLHEQDLGTMRDYHEQIGEIPPSNVLRAWWRGFVLGRR